MTERYFIGSLIRNDEWILDKFLDHIVDLNVPKKETILCFIVNDCEDKSEEMLREFAEKHRLDYKKIIVTTFDFNENAIGAGSSRLNAADPLMRRTKASYGDRGKLYNNLSILRNLMKKLLVERSDAEWLINIDSDILVPPDTVEKLTDTPGPRIRGAMVINDWLQFKNKREQLMYRLCNAGVEVDKGEQKKITHFLSYKMNEVHPVQVTGACFAMHRDLAEKSDYKFHQWGEDAGFCVDLPKETPVEFDTRVVPFHVMEIDMLNWYEEFKAVTSNGNN